MRSLSKFTGLVLAPLCMGLICCSFPVRTGYDRNIGDYKPVPASETATAQAASKPSETATQEPPTSQKTTSAVPDSTKKPELRRKGTRCHQQEGNRQGGSQVYSPREFRKLRPSMAWGKIRLCHGHQDQNGLFRLRDAGLQGLLRHFS